MGLSGNDALREFMDKLAVSNVSRYIELPMIAVMGDTSSGKSSLLTSISMVELPSSEKLTTRCPIMLQMKRADTRTAEVSVEWKESRPITGDSTLPAAFNKSVDDSTWDELTGHIADAQDHIMKIANKAAANDVSRDIVKVKVTGPNCEDLTLIDLPGIVRSTGAGESASLVQDIQCLIDDYLKNSRCVILAVHPANVDFHNSQIMADAKKVDPETKRTLPVITKPDLIDSGAEEGVKDLLLGLKTDKFEKGFHIVKGRGQKALNAKQSIKKSLQIEKNFFQQTLPWRNVANRGLFGIDALRTKLGELQIQMVRETFPAIQREMKEKKESAILELAALGKPCETISDKRRLYSDLLRRINNEISDTLHGKNLILSSKRKHTSLAGDFHTRCDEFSKTLLKSQLSGILDPRTGQDVIVAGTEEWKGEIIKTAPGKVYLRCEDNEEEWVGISEVRRDPAWIEEFLLKHRSLDIPIFPNPSIFNGLVSKFIEDDWEGPCSTFLDEVMQILREAVTNAIISEKRLKRYPRLLPFLKERYEQIVKDSFDMAHEELRQYIQNEKKPYTQNDYLSETISRLRSKPLEKKLTDALGIGSAYDVNKAHHTMTLSQIKAIVDGIFNQNRNKSLDEHMAEDMQNSLHAYGKVAFKRFADEVPKIGKEVLENYAIKAEESLSDLSEEKLDALISESPENRATYDNLEQKIQVLEQGLKIIDGLAF